MSKVFDWLTETVGWLQIVASPLLIGIGIGGIIYLLNPNATVLIIGISLAFLGLIVGIIWATKIWKTRAGTIGFLSRISETPDLDKQATETNEVQGDNKNGIV